MTNRQRGAIRIEWILLIGGIALIAGAAFFNFSRHRIHPVCPPVDHTQGPCAGDSPKLCPGKTGYELEECLDMQFAQLSPACQVAINPCKSENETICKGVKDRLHCLLDHHAQLSAACGESIDRHLKCMKDSGKSP